MNILQTIGAPTLKKWHAVCSVSMVTWGILRLAAGRAHWTRPVREQVSKQILFTGIDAIGITLLISALAGISVVAQVQLWLSKIGQSAMLGNILVTVIAREIGPLLVNFLVIGRSGTAIAAELAYMRVRNEIDVLEARGIDPMVYLVMPRVIGTLVSVFGLTILFIAFSFVSGYAFGFLLGVTPGDPSLFANSILKTLFPSDILNLCAKTLIPGTTTAVICCIEGLGVRGAATDIPRAVTAGVVKSIAAVLIISVIVSVLTYG